LSYVKNIAKKVNNNYRKEIINKVILGLNLDKNSIIGNVIKITNGVIIIAT